MAMKPGTLSVELGNRAYAIVLGKGLRPKVDAFFAKLRAKKRRVVVVADTRFAKKNHAFMDGLADNVILLPSGEKTKSLGQLEKLLGQLSRSRLDRTGVLAAVGGGVTGDLVGFAAASYQRGIDFVQVPTTLLAMVDSSVGGKTGVNLPEGKNLVGAFHQPIGVFADMGLLKTLPAREFNAGMAEVIKCALIADAELFEKLETKAPFKWDSPELPTLIRACCALKADIVRKDERETAKTGGRALLNLGHTFGHAIEKVGGYGCYLHGEAVALGLVMAAELSVRLKTLSAKNAARVKDLLEKQGLPIRLKEVLPLRELMQALKRDKKVRAGVLRFVTMKGLGKAVTRDNVKEADAAACFLKIGARQ